MKEEDPAWEERTGVSLGWELWLELSGGVLGSVQKAQALMHSRGNEKGKTVSCFLLSRRYQLITDFYQGVMVVLGGDHDLAQVENEYARVSSLLPPREPSCRFPSSMTFKYIEL